MWLMTHGPPPPLLLLLLPPTAQLLVANVSLRSVASADDLSSDRLLLTPPLSDGTFSCGELRPCGFKDVGRKPDSALVVEAPLFTPFTGRDVGGAGCIDHGRECASGRVLHLQPGHEGFRAFIVLLVNSVGFLM